MVDSFTLVGAESSDGMWKMLSQVMRFGGRPVQALTA